MIILIQAVGMSSTKDSRQQAKHLQQSFLNTTQSSIQSLSSELQKSLIHTLLLCPSPQHIQQKLHNITQLNKNAHNLLQHIGNSLQQCIRRQYEYQGIEGYKKCYLMFQRVMDWEFRDIGKKGFRGDADVSRGIRESVESKRYGKMKGGIFGDGRDRG